MKEALDGIDAEFVRLQNGGEVVETDDAGATMTRAKAALSAVTKLLRYLDGLLTIKGLRRKALLKRPAMNLVGCIERCQDLLEWIDDVEHSSEIEEIFTVAEGEFERGETVAHLQQ